MLSGATLMNYRKRYSTVMFCKRRVKKIVIPYIFWSLFYLIFYIVCGDITITNAEDLVIRVVNSVTAYDSNHIFWFFSALINVYLCMPLLLLIANERFAKLRWYLIGIGVITRMVLPLVSQFTPISFREHSKLYVMGDYLLYALLGYQLYIYKVNKWQDWERFAQV